MRSAAKDLSDVLACRWLRGAVLGVVFVVCTDVEFSSFARCLDSLQFGCSRLLSQVLYRRQLDSSLTARTPTIGQSPALPIRADASNQQQPQAIALLIIC